MARTKKIILEVNQGIISLQSGGQHLEGIQLEVRDRDVEGIDGEHIKRDSKGEYFLQDI